MADTDSGSPPLTPADHAALAHAHGEAAQAHLDDMRLHLAAASGDDDDSATAGDSTPAVVPATKSVAAVHDGNHAATAQAFRPRVS